MVNAIKSIRFHTNNKKYKKILGKFCFDQSQAGFEPTRLRAVNGSGENRLDLSTIWAH